MQGAVRVRGGLQGHRVQPRERGQVRGLDARWRHQLGPAGERVLVPALPAVLRDRGRRRRRRVPGRQRQRQLSLLLLRAHGRGLALGVQGALPRHQALLHGHRVHQRPGRALRGLDARAGRGRGSSHGRVYLPEAAERLRGRAAQWRAAQCRPDRRARGAHAGPRNGGRDGRARPHSRDRPRLQRREDARHQRRGDDADDRSRVLVAGKAWLTPYPQHVRRLSEAGAEGWSSRPGRDYEAVCCAAFGDNSACMLRGKWSRSIWPPDANTHMQGAPRLRHGPHAGRALRPGRRGGGDPLHVPRGPLPELGPRLLRPPRRPGAHGRLQRHARGGRRAAAGRGRGGERRRHRVRTRDRRRPALGRGRSRLLP
mmetsp:Transcript_3055/g.6118  ORF Transcript_3055/g.6118 Transcript_3055/m.6118 type:complete len:369 (+) Transcript_3055:232-1338(+)